LIDCLALRQDRAQGRKDERKRFRPTQRPYALEALDLPVKAM